MKILCQYCGTEFNKPYCHFKRTKRHFCCVACRNLADQVKITVFCKMCGKQFEIRPSEKCKYSTCSKDCQRKSRKDELNVNWKGGVWKNISNERRILMAQLEYKQWRKAVFERDDYTCQLCNRRGGALEADHILPWATHPTLRYDINNGRTLCVECHRKTFTRKKII
jgi:hypothetical protein